MFLCGLLLSKVTEFPDTRAQCRLEIRGELPGPFCLTAGGYRFDLLTPNLDCLLEHPFDCRNIRIEIELQADRDHHFLKLSVVSGYISKLKPRWDVHLSGDDDQLG